MSKHKGKKIVSRKRLNPENSSTSSHKDSVPKKKQCVKKISKDGIAKSKKLIEKLRTCGKSSTRKRDSSTQINNEHRICGNGKPMPPLTELEAMFEDSDDDNESPPAAIPNSSKEQPDNLNSETIKNITSKIIEFVSNFPECTPDEQDPRPPIIPPKKRKKPEVPYIVGCKDRPKVPYRPSVNFCKGDDYGIDKNSRNDNDDIPTKRAKRTKGLNFSKSIFNAQSDEIAAKLKECDNDSVSSSDSDKTIEYEYSNPQPSWPRSFCPLPSTSKDNSTILQNDKRFNDSLMQEKLTNDHENNIVVPCETVIIDDVIEVDVNTEVKEISKHINIHENDDCIEILEPKQKHENVENIDCTATIDINSYNFDYSPDYKEITETIDIDDVIAENKAIIEKYSQFEKINSVTHVDLTDLTNLNMSENISNKSLNTANSTNSTNNVITSVHENLNLPQDRNNQSKSVRSVPKESETCKVIREVITNFFADKSSNPAHNNDQPSQNVSINDNTIIFDDNILPTMPNQVENNQIQNLTCEYRLSNAVKYTNPHNNTSTVATVHSTQNAYHNHFINNNASNSLNRTSSIRNSEIIDVTSTVLDVCRKRKRRNKNKALSTSIVISPAPQALESQINDKPKGIGDCPICMDSLANNSVASTLCGHVFCMKCIKAAIKSNGKKCPTCRKVLKGVGYHQLFL